MQKYEYIKYVIVGAVCFLALGAAMNVGRAQHGGHSTDGRELVAIPEPMRSHMLANMRDHLAALEEIQSAMATGDVNAAAKIAEQRIGMSSLGSHGASHIAGFMPKGMQEAGTAMHRTASQFARIVIDSGVTGDIKPALSALSDVTKTCVACHQGYRVH